MERDIFFPPVLFFLFGLGIIIILVYRNHIGFRNFYIEGFEAAVCIIEIGEIKRESTVTAVVAGIVIVYRTARSCRNPV